jgi:hypothetical protein
MLELLDQQVEQAAVTATFDGVVLNGDLRRRVGQILPQGEPLYQISLESGWVLQVQVPESASADMAADLTGRFTSHVRPGSEQDFRVVRVHPTAEPAGGENACIVEARLDSQTKWLRDGMKGMAKVHVGPRPVWWVVSHRLTDYLRLKLWL